MTDKELLELAAKACGMTVQEALAKIGKPISLYSEWNPLGHDSDCATHNEPAYPNGDCNCSKSAIVRAAAEIGKQKG